ncbi:MAG TPA: PLP-dependent aminotransferase family protein [Vicinamibacterales bacterium]|nr:PLP-dependent aminotransferase family protein [Vicinamibacterales bacterium]
MESNTLARRAARLSAIMPESEHGGIIFGSGDAFPGVLPDLTAAADVALTKYRSETLQYAPRPGLPELREWIAGYMKDDGANVTADDVVVVNGAKHGIDLVCRILLEEGDSIVVTSPTYFTAIPLFRSFGVEFVEVGQDAEGMIVDEVADAFDAAVKQGRRLPKFIYDVPDFHNPTGLTTSRRRREQLVEVASKYGVWIVEDSPYRKVRFEGESEPTLKALGGARTILVGTFAKLVAPGLRIGWLSAAPEILTRVPQLKSDGGSCPLTQRIILEFCRAGHLSAHIDKVQKLYREHRDQMVAAVRRHIPEASFAVPHGGYYLWLRLPDAMDGDELARRAARANVTIIPGSKFFAGRRGGPPKNFVRLAHSYSTLEQIDEGVSALGAAYHSMTDLQLAGRTAS